MRIFNHRHEEIAVHVKIDPGRFSTQAGHLAPEKISGIERGAEWLLKKASNLGEHADQWAQSAILDRFLHHAEVIEIQGQSYRMKDRGQTKKKSGHAESTKSK